MHVEQQTEDSVLGTQRITSEAPDRSVSAHFACKRVVQENRVVIVWESLAISKASASRGTPAARVATTGYGIIRRGASPYGGSDGDCSVLQSYVRVTPTLLGTEQEGGDNDEYGDDSSSSDANSAREVPDSGFLAEPMIATYEQQTQTVWQAIENALLDDQMRRAGCAHPIE